MRIRILTCILAIFSVAGCSAGGSGSSAASSAGLLLGLMSGLQPNEMGMARVNLRLSSDLVNQQNRRQANGPAATAQASVTRVDLTVTGPGIAAPIGASLADSGGGVWSGTVPGIPAGADRIFLARAYDAGNALLYEGSVVGVTVAFEQTAQIMIQMQESNPAAGYSNVAPVIDSFAMSGAQILPGQTVAFAVAASDENAGDTLSYAWTADGGSFDNAAITDPVWTAPTAFGNYTLTVNVADQSGANAAFSVVVTVDPGTGNGAVDASFNNAPLVSSVSATPTHIDLSEATNLAAVATDADGHALTYAWASDCGGSFSDATLANPVFTAPAAYPTANKCTLSVTVDDGNGATNTGDLGIRVAAPVGIVVDSQAPTVTAFALNPTSIDTTNSDETVNLTITIADDQALPGAGRTNLRLELKSPNGMLSVFFDALSEDAQPGGTATLRSFLVPAVIPQGSEGGDWTVASLRMNDAIGNTVSLTGTQLSALGFAATVDNGAGSPDNIKPVLTALSISPTEIDTTNGPATVIVTATITDNRALLVDNLTNWAIQTSIGGRLLSGFRTQNMPQIINPEDAEPGSTLRSRTYRLEYILPQYSSAGEWRVNFAQFQDAAGNFTSVNTSGFNATLQNVATIEDITLPTFSALSVDTPVVSVADGPADFQLTVTMSDDFALQSTARDFMQAPFVLLNPSGEWAEIISFSADALQPGGTATSRTYVITGRIPQGSPTGEWRFAQFNLTDRANNYKFFQQADIDALGFSNKMIVQ